MKKMGSIVGRIIGVAVVALLLVSTPAMSADAVSPAAHTNLVNARDDSVETISGSYVKGTSLIFTNAVALETGGTTQGLDGVAIEIRVGNTTTSTAYSATAYTNAFGVTNLWWANVSIPTNLSGTLSLQTKLTDAATNIYIYPLKRINMTEPLD